MKIIIAGAGEVGSHLAKMLSEEKNNNLTIIDHSESRLNKLSEIADVVTVFGNPTSIATLNKPAQPNLWNFQEVNSKWLYSGSMKELP